VVSNEYMKAEMLRDIQLTIARWTQKLHLLDQDLADAILDLETRVSPQADAVEARRA